MFNFDLNRIIMLLPGILVGLTIHEYAHGYVAYRLGDNTAKNSGRLTLNPVDHIDPLGFLMLMFAGFGWAKPVPVNPFFFRDRRKGMLLVSLAGPVSNLIAATVLTIILGIILRVTGTFNPQLFQFFQLAIGINLVLAVFNLLPVPPLDGSKILMSLFPSRFEQTFHQFEQYSYIVLILLLVTGVVSAILLPIVNALRSLLFVLLALMT